MDKIKARPVFKEQPLTKAALIKMIREAEQGPFYTSAEIKERMKKWKR